MRPRWQLAEVQDQEPGTVWGRSQVVVSSGWGVAWCACSLAGRPGVGVPGWGCGLVVKFLAVGGRVLGCGAGRPGGWLTARMS